MRLLLQFAQVTALEFADESNVDVNDIAYLMTSLYDLMIQCRLGERLIIKQVRGF